MTHLQREYGTIDIKIAMLRQLLTRTFPLCSTTYDLVFPIHSYVTAKKLSLAQPDICCTKQGMVLNCKIFSFQSIPVVSPQMSGW